MITSRLTSKAQTTIPQPVRTALGLQAGDELSYAIENGFVILNRVNHRLPSEDPFVVFDEWFSEADSEAYKNL